MAKATMPQQAAGATHVRPAALARWRDYLLTEVDGASLALFRILFGLVMVWEVIRYFQHGWIARYYIDPAFHFSYLPFIQPWEGQGRLFSLGLTTGSAHSQTLALYSGQHECLVRVLRPLDELRKA